jgi:cation:H+ antiporter
MSSFYFIIFAFSCFILYFVGNWIIDGLSRIARFLGLREFVVAFVLMALTASLPNLFVGILSIIHQVPTLSFGDVVGGNVVDLTLAIALAILFSKGKVKAESRTVQSTALFTLVAAVLPIILVLDNSLSRTDGLVLIGLFIFFIFWLFSKKERFTRTYTLEERGTGTEVILGFKDFFRGLGKVLISVVLLLLAGEGIVRSAMVFSEYFGLSLGVIGILIVGLGNALPETYFAVASAKKGESWMILGDLMGAVIVPATLVLGLVALFSPIKNIDFSPFLIARIFLVFAAVFFFSFIKTGQELTKKEALFLLLLYVLFLGSEISRLI